MTKQRKGFGIVSESGELQHKPKKKQPAKKKLTRKRKTTSTSEVPRKRTRKKSSPAPVDNQHIERDTTPSVSSVPIDIPPTYIKFISTKKDLPPNEHKDIIIWDVWGFDIAKSDIVRQHILDDVQHKREIRTKYWSKLEK